MLVKFEQNRMVQTARSFELFDKKKTGFYVTIFDKELTQFGIRFCSLKQLFNVYNYRLTINLKTIIFQCSENFGTPTLGTRLKVSPNMADPISLNENLPLFLRVMGSK